MAARRRYRSRMRYSAVVEDIVRWQVRHVGEFRDHVKSAHRTEVRSLERTAEELPDDDELLEHLSEDYHTLERIVELADQLAIVALYRVVEMNTAKIMAQRYGAAAVENACYVSWVKKKLAQDHRCLEKVPHYRVMDELRCLCNAIKHRGCVSKELARYYRWRLGAPLAGLDAAYERLAPRVPRYLRRLAEAVKADRYWARKPAPS